MLVLDLTRLLPGPLAGKILAEMGYDVLRLVAPTGDMLEHIAPDTFQWMHERKRTESLDLKSHAGVERLRDLASHAAILLDTNRPGVMERLGVGPDTLLMLNPRLTYVRIAGFRDEQFHAEPGHDLAYLAADGLLERLSPAALQLQLADSTGAMWAALAAVEGVRKGGGFYEVYLAEAARVLAYPPILGLDGKLVCYSIYPCREGQIVLAGLEVHLWQRFCVAIERPEWLNEALGDADASNPTWRDICAVFAERTAHEWEAWALEHHVPLRAIAPNRVPSSVVPWKEQRA